MAYRLKDGKELWQTPITGNYEASADVFYVNGTLWLGGKNPVQVDPESGKEISKIVQKMTGPMGHDRCYRNMITERYFINTKTGGADFLDLEKGTEIPHHWTRGTCGLGILPANGLLYSTPYSCTCSVGAMFPGMNAYASIRGLAKSEQAVPVERSPRLETGPAYKQSTKASAAADDWPQYRNDGFRSGISSSRISPELKIKWETRLIGNPSAMTVAAGKVFVSDVESHTLYALDRETGKEVWTYTASGRIDSPPVFHEGTVLFGDRGGWVYCLDASDGQLAWRFKDLPDKLIGAYGQLESAWPVYGSVLILGDTLYFAAGRSSFLDGGMFLYSLDPRTGKLLNSRSFYGPFEEDSGFPVGRQAGFLNDILSTDGKTLYLRHKAFDLDLADAPDGHHIVATGGFLDSQIQHRTDWALSSTVGNSYARQSGDILVSNGKEYYGLTGFPLYMNHSYFDPRKKGYTLFARRTAPANDSGKDARKEKRSEKSKKVYAARDQVLWNSNIPTTGKAMAMAGDVLFVAGEPMKFDQPSFTNYVKAYAGELGGRLLAISNKDGSQLAEYSLEAAPAWDSIAIANQNLFMALEDGTVLCMSD
jgi:outer membrane protein assembly factor BamB